MNRKEVKIVISYIKLLYRTFNDQDFADVLSTQKGFTDATVKII